MSMPHLDEELERLERARPDWARNLTPTLVYLLAVATIGPLLFGYHLAELNTPQDVLSCAKKTYTPHAYMSPLPACIPMNELEIGLVTSLFTLGGLLGALAAGGLSQKHGRLRTMQCNTVFFIAGPLAEALAGNVAILAFGRFISGLGAGTAVVVVPIYIAEIAPPAQKGFFGSFTQIMTCLGIVLTQFLGLFLSRSQLWRVILGIGGIIGFVQLLALIFAIESPKWVATAKGDVVGAKARIQRIRGRDVDIRAEVDSWNSSGDQSSQGKSHPRQSPATKPRMASHLLPDSGAARPIRLRSLSSSAKKPDSDWDYQVDAEALIDEDDELLAGIDDGERAGHRSTAKEQLNILTVLLSPKYARPTLIIMFVMVAQQFAGINSIVFYGVNVLSSLLSSSSALVNLFVAMFNLVVTVAGAPLVDRLGRKPCLLFSLAGMAVSSLALAVAIQTNVPLLSGVAVFGFVGSFGFGLGPVPFILASEFVGPEAVGATQSWALAANWIATFIVAQFFPILNTKLGKGQVYYLFVGLDAIFAAFIWKMVPETQGKRNSDEVWASFGSASAQGPTVSERED